MSWTPSQHDAIRVPNGHCKAACKDVGSRTYSTLLLLHSVGQNETSGQPILKKLENRFYLLMEECQYSIAEEYLHRKAYSTGDHYHNNLPHLGLK